MLLKGGLPDADSVLETEPALPAFQPIPHPPLKPVIGNVLDVSSTTPIQDLIALARELGPIFQLDMMGKPFTVISGHALAAELFDETRFDKSVRGALHRVRDIAGDGLFTAYTTEPNWSKAHNILLPNFGQRAMHGYHGMMLDVAEQLMLKWQRLNADDEIDVVHDMTALTLDTIGLCGFGYRLNSFYREEHHPFIYAMMDALGIAMSEKNLPLQAIFGRAKRQRMENDARTMNAVVDRIIADRKAELASGAEAKDDLLGYMLSGIDKKSGERLDDTNIRYQIITFLIAGHETTSGLLSFALYFLLNHPDVLARAYEEVDRVFGTDLERKPTVKEVNGLHYVGQILNETLRLWPPAPAFSVLPYKDEVLGGKYRLKARSQLTILLPMLHRDKSVWGERAEAFDPDNFSPEAQAGRPASAFKPFGNGRRACIGRQFATQEATLVLGMILQRFKLIDHERYQLRLREALTVKLEGLKIKVRPRTHAHLAVAAATPVKSAGDLAPSAPAAVSVPKHGTPLLVLFGSNLGSAEDAARQLAQAGAARGFEVRLGWLDDYARKLPAEGALLIVCASYNGAPPDNAADFYAWLRDEAAPGSLAGVKYCVFGCGNRNWASTYQAVPRFLDERLAACGAERIYERGEGDAREDPDGDLEAWRRPLWSAVARHLDLRLEGSSEPAEETRYALEIVPGLQANPVAASHGATPMRVLVNRELQSGGVRSTRHIELGIPAGAAYRAGDHLGVVPANGAELVARVLRRFGYDAGTYVRLSSNGTRIPALPTQTSLALETLLVTYVELQHTATRKQIALLAEHTNCPHTKPALLRLAAAEDGDSSPYKNEVKRKRKSVLDLLEEYPACELPLERYLEMLPLMTPRYYSISSSPLAAPERCSITVGVVRGEAPSGRGIFEGVASAQLQREREGEFVNAFLKDSKSGFRLPEDPSRPIVMIGPGTGLAPFRGFLAERNILQERGARLGRALLFFGCRRPDEDYIYRDELEAYAARGVVELSVSFSRLHERKRYVQDALAERAAEIWGLLEEGAIVYVCGDGSAMEPAVRQTLLELHRSQTGSSAESSASWLAKLSAQNRYVLDVWASA